MRPTHRSAQTTTPIGAHEIQSTPRRSSASAPTPGQGARSSLRSQPLRRRPNPKSPYRPPAPRGFVLRRLSYAKRRPKLITEEEARQRGINSTTFGAHAPILIIPAVSARASKADAFQRAVTGRSGWFSAGPLSSADALEP